MIIDRCPRSAVRRDTGRDRPGMLDHVSDHRGPSDKSFLIGGPEHRDIVLVEYDHRWPDRFAQERARIHTALGPVAQQVEHVASTAVPGLLAKPIIGVLLTLTDVEDEARYLPQRIEAGYLLRVREPGHRMLRTPDLNVHVHVRPTSAATAEATLAFRDRLRADVSNGPRGDDHVPLRGRPTEPAIGYRVRRSRLASVGRNPQESR